MPVLDFGTPPSLGADAKYGDYRPWLERAQYLRVCAYCLLRHISVEIDHFEPQLYAPKRLHDPTNLLLGCQACNGRGGKSDYHPLHIGRTRLPGDRSGHAVVDVRVDDFGALFELSPNGTIRARNGRSRDRAEWNLVLLNLRREVYDKVRGENLETLMVAERLVSLLARGTARSQESILEELLAKQVGFIARTLPFFRAFGLAMTPGLRSRVEAARLLELPTT